jgi:hypothetical protein
MATTTTSRPAPKEKPVREGSSRPPGVLTWATVGLIIVVILVVVMVKLLSSSPSSTRVFVATPTAIVAELTGVPMSVFNTVGITAPRVTITDPVVLKGQPPLDWKLDGVTKPTLLYIGAEYTPYSAAEWWPLIIALSRFGTFANLGNVQSSSTDIYKDTQSFTLWKTTYTSSYLNFVHIEEYSNVSSTSTATGYAVLQTPTAAETAVENTYDSPTFVPNLPQTGTSPFISFNNKILIVGSNFPPQSLAGSSRTQISGALSSPSNYVTQGIIASANFVSASVCAMDQQQPSSVCQSSGVRAADHSMKIGS